MLEPIQTTGLTAADVDGLTSSTRALMLKELIDLTEKVRGQPVAMSTAQHMNGVTKATGVAMKVAA